MAASSPRVKKEHYVPQLHLREWATDECVHVFDKTSCKQFPANIGRIGCEEAFYDDAELDELVGVPQSLEKFFRGFEDAGAAVIRDTLGSIRTGNLSVLPESARIDLAIFLGVQQLRTKRARAEAGDLMEAISKQQFIAYLRRTQPDFPIEESWLEMEANERARFAVQLHLVRDEETRVGMAGVFFHRHWLLMQNRQATGMHTSDHPIVEYGEVTPEGECLARTLALQAVSKSGSKGLFGKLMPALLMNVFAVAPVAIFPLAPDVVLVMLDRAKYPKFASQDGKLQDMDVRDTEFYNGLQVLQSHRQIYSRDPDFQLAERLCKSAA